MSKLYFKYGAMGSSKTANLLITKFNYEEKGKRVLLLKPATDDRDGVATVKSRIGLSAEAEVIGNGSIMAKYASKIRIVDVILVDEAQFLTESQINELHEIVTGYNIPVICYGLLTDFTSHMFEGSKRLIEIAESIAEIKTVCECGRKATINARMDSYGHVVTSGEQIAIGGNDMYKSMCYACWRKATMHNEANLHIW